MQFVPWHVIKSQALADFVIEWTPVLDFEQAKETALPAANDGKTWTLEHWSVNFNRSLTLERADAEVVLTCSDGQTLKYVIQLDFRATNNMAECEDLLVGLRAAVRLGIHHLLVKEDSELVMNKVSKEYQCVDAWIAAYMAEVRRME